MKEREELTDHQKKEMEDEIQKLMDHLKEKLNKRSLYIMVDGVTLTGLERVLNEVGCITNYRVFKIVDETHLFQPGSVIAGTGRPQAVPVKMYYIILKREEA